MNQQKTKENKIKNALKASIFSTSPDAETETFKVGSWDSFSSFDYFLISVGGPNEKDFPILFFETGHIIIRHFGLFFI